MQADRSEPVEYNDGFSDVSRFSLARVESIMKIA